LRGEAIAAIQSGLTKDLVGWKKLFIKN
jgi:hypothetical protein